MKISLKQKLIQAHISKGFVKNHNREFLSSGAFFNLNDYPPCRAQIESMQGHIYYKFGNKNSPGGGDELILILIPVSLLCFRFSGALLLWGKVNHNTNHF